MNGSGQRYRIVDGIRVKVSAPSPAADSKAVSSLPDSPEQLSTSVPFCLVAELQQPPPARTLRILAKVNSRGIVWLSLRAAGNPDANPTRDERREGRRDRVDFPLVSSPQALIDAMTTALRGAQALPVPLSDDTPELEVQLSTAREKERRRSLLTLHSGNSNDNKHDDENH